MAPKGLGLLCALMPPGQTAPPPFQEVPIVARKKKVVFGLLCSCVICPGLSVDEESRWVLEIAEQSSAKELRKELLSSCV